jgi:Mandelate racemase / muconate lactonizing enzyme, N-terminal domain
VQIERKTIEVDAISASDLTVDDLGRAASLVLVDLQTNEGIPCRGYAFAYARLMLHWAVQFLRDVESALIGKASHRASALDSSTGDRSSCADRER